MTIGEHAPSRICTTVKKEKEAAGSLFPVVLSVDIIFLQFSKERFLWDFGV